MRTRLPSSRATGPAAGPYQGSVVLNLISISLSIAKLYVPVLFFLVLLLGATAFVPPASAEPPVWRTSTDLIKKSPKSFPRLDKAGIEAVIKRLPKSLSLIRDYLRDKDATVLSHKGDLTIDGSFDNGHILVVDGNLTIRGSYDDYRDGIGIIVVLGDMRAEHVVSWGSIAVTGTLEASGLVYAYYNDFTFEVAGTVKARALVVFDKSTNYERVDVRFLQTDDGENSALAVRHFVPELMIEDVLDKTDADTADLYAVASYEAARKRIEAGQPIFRDTLGPESLAEDVVRLYKPKVDAAMMARLAKADRLLAMVVATKETVPVDVQKEMAASGDAAVLELLAKNPKVDRAVLARIAKTNAATAASVAKNPNAPPEAMTSLAASSDPATRVGLLDNPSLDVAVLSRLASDKVLSVRQALAQSPQVRRLPAADLTRLMADADADVRVALTRHDAVLSVEQLAVLARDKNPKVRQATATSLSQQALWQAVPVGTPAARAAVIATLVKDAAPEVRVAALVGATAADQEQFVANFKDADRPAVLAEIAAVTRSKILMERAAVSDQAAAEGLAKNLAIPPALQLHLIGKLPDASKRPRISIVDYEALSRQAQSWDAVIDELVQNPNVTPEALLAVAKYCRAASGRPGFCAALLHRRDLSAEVFETLDGAGDMEEWALSALLSYNTTRKQIERAVPRWYDDEPEILAEFKKLRSLPDSAFWNALAASKQVKLREVAAAHVATPPATLARLINDPEGDVAGLASINPATPAEALANTRAGSSWVLNNPRVPDKLVRSLLDRALLDAEYNVASECKKVFAARALRSAP
jgi:hypothetical protein